ncbi:zinc finger protein 99-like [Helicoverpa zea]|uniref:zinc finger protein 99-like n=1 Tax=Helicoverpa zea TaxID=7113 RepID=UPI001F5A4889|nr:zinc finger protein 99-like [Helicoverpa zea]
MNLPLKTSIIIQETDLFFIVISTHPLSLWVQHGQWDKIGPTEDKDISNAQRNRNILAKFKQNVRCILEFTDATPIRGHWGIGYACIYCNYQNPQPAKLKTHTLKTHPENIDEVDNVKYVADMIIKIDITDVKCKLCDINMDSLDEIMDHLKSAHDKPIHFDINNHIVPFKFGTEFLQCAVCAKQFDYFKHLSEHMNEHYPNYECKECSRNFVNHRAYRTHIIRHKKGTFVCAFCPKIFDTRIKMKEHERVLHLKGSKTRKCGYCDERFMDAVRKQEHEVKEHGAPIPQFACKACGKPFDSQRSLKEHTKHFHLLLRPHVCSECGKGFYNKTEMKRHLVKHTKIKEYQCNICSKFYVTASCLRSHLKIHDNDRGFTCEICGDTFVQKKSLNLHAAKHAKSVVDDLENADSVDSTEIPYNATE